PLFVRVPGGVAPTAKAERLARAVGGALQALDLAIQESEAFDPAASERTFRLYMTDIGELMFLPRLMESLRRDSPRLGIEVHQLDPGGIMPALEGGTLDLALGYLPQLSGARREALLREHYVVLLRAGHPLAARRATAATLAGLEYIVVRSHAETGRRLKALGLEGKVRLSLPHFLAIPAILARTDLATLLPYRLARTFMEGGDFRLLELSPRAPEIPVAVHWYWRYENDPGIRWLRNRIVELFRED
ncbi:MAG: hypothetical protein JNM82_17670, partial [Rhodocyclaceae bacterium]|nr:hypothetical protein [Rhodocyclaceae bacterium]